MTMTADRPAGFPNITLAPFHCECGKCIGEIDYSQPHTERKWCRDCKTWTVIVVLRARVH
jgi:hypothetical protein